MWEADVSHRGSGYKRHVNFSDAVDICCAFLRGMCTDLYPLLERKLLPFRPGRAYPRHEISENRLSFLYKAAR